MRSTTNGLLALPLLFLLLSTPPLQAQEFSDQPGIPALLEKMTPYQQLLAEATFYTASGQHRRASDLLARMIEVRPYDPTLWFLLAQSLNRQERWQEAYRAAEIAIALDPNATHYLVERAAAALETSRPAEAKRDAETVLRVLPDHLHSRYILARSQLDLGDTTAATAQFQQLAETTPAMRAPSEFFTAEAAAADGDTSTAAHHYARFFTMAQPAFPSGMPDDMLLASSKRWSGYLSLGLTYNSNVVSSNDTAILPIGISQRHDWAFTLGAGAFFRPIDTPHQSLLIGSRFYQSLQFTLDDFDLTQITPVLVWNWNPTSHWSVGVELGGEMTWLGGSPYRWSISPTPYLTYRWAGGNHLSRLSVQPSVARYFDSACCVLNRDGVNTTLALSHQMAAAWGQLKCYWNFGWMNTQGAEFQGTFTSIGLNAWLRLPYEFQWQSRVEFTYYSYDNPSAFSPTGQRQRYPTYTAGSRLVRPIFRPDLEAYLDYNYLNNDSNVQAYRYHQHLVRFGMTWSF